MRPPPGGRSSIKRREQALLFLRKAAQDESLLDAVSESDNVSDEVIAFHSTETARGLAARQNRALLPRPLTPQDVRPAR